MLVRLTTLSPDLPQELSHATCYHLAMCCKAAVSASVLCMFCCVAGNQLAWIVHEYTPTLLPCRTFRDELDVLQPFRDKELQGVLLCNDITSHHVARQSLLSYDQQQHFKIYTMAGGMYYMYREVDMCDELPKRKGNKPCQL
jgi:hypothetical protein